MSLLEVRDLTTSFRTGGGEVTAVENLSYSLEKGEILGNCAFDPLRFHVGVTMLAPG